MPVVSLFKVLGDYFHLTVLYDFSTEISAMLTLLHLFKAC